MDSNLEAPPIISEIPPPPAKGPWGFWATLGWALVIGILWVGVQVVVVIAYIAGLALIHHGNAKQISYESIETHGDLMWVAATLSGAAGVALAILLVKLRNGPSLKDYFGLFWPEKKKILLWIGSLVMFVMAADYLTNVLGRPVVPEVMTELFRNTAVVPFLWFALLVAAPVSEELIFRGFIFRGLESSRARAAGTILITSALWAGIHMQYDAYGMLWIFLGGIILGLARLKTGSVLLCVAAHATMNLISLVETRLYP
jgi:membrane protease YdiL (CAAX protease family)